MVLISNSGHLGLMAPPPSLFFVPLIQLTKHQNLILLARILSMAVEAGGILDISLIGGGTFHTLSGKNLQWRHHLDVVVCSFVHVVCKVKRKKQGVVFVL